MTQDDIVDTLNDLIETSKDGEYGFRTSAEYAKAPEIKDLFTRRAAECGQAAAELQTLVRQCGGKPEDSGSAAGAVHRGWVAVKGTLAGYSDKAILEETERGEDTALASYRKALEKALPPDLRAVVERQYEGAKRNHDQVRQLRNMARAATS
ncbi:PA2169 family four-helix-bundle protein [Hydrogenophaga pseudoflava]|uniref:PA2169 family four-helix-bundle protein n=1 Tax=Hydrogenophaga pseudoflava TaxID=47421 RepID=UPI0027E4C5F8|nr:PA2169 family four-helix-bundle protein [Hydrogenophaga pseudoflava]MDQ7744358.1 PA2169 family four-helix-bundle protein [Hydrogenophaga pseudoflava]